jgi:hypothetical protein
MFSGKSKFTIAVIIDTILPNSTRAADMLAAGTQYLVARQLSNRSAAGWRKARGGVLPRCGKSNPDSACHPMCLVLKTARRGRAGGCNRGFPGLRKRLSRAGSFVVFSGSFPWQAK